MLAMPCPHPATVHRHPAADQTRVAEGTHAIVARDAALQGGEIPAHDLDVAQSLLPTGWVEKGERGWLFRVELSREGSAPSTHNSKWVLHEFHKEAKLPHCQGRVAHCTQKAYLCLGQMTGVCRTTVISSFP